MDLNDHGYAEVYAEVYSEGDTFEASEGVKEECWETDILHSIYRHMSHAAVAVGSRPRSCRTERRQRMAKINGIGR